MAEENQPSTPPKPISLRDSAPPGPAIPQETDKQLTLLLIMTAAAFLMGGLLFGSLLSRSGDKGVSKSELRAAVAQAVGTQVAARPSGEAEAGSVNPEELQALIDAAVGTQVQAMIPTSTPIPPTPTLIPNPIASDDDAFLGPEDAKVVIVEFSDFQCGYCGKWYQETLLKILEAYPDDVKFVYRDFPIFGDDSVRAAMASECAEEQGKFWEMHNRLFDLHNSEEEVQLSQETLVSLAGELELDTDAFTECLVSEKYLDEIINDYQTARAYGFGGTPGFVINGVVYPFGAQSFDVFNDIIKQALAEAS